MKPLLTMALVIGLIAPLYSQSSSDSCPKEVPAGTTCYRGKDQNGAYYLIAIPKNYNHNLVLFMHGGGTPPATPVRAWGRWASFLNDGFAMASSSFREDFTIHQAIDDTKNLKEIFMEKFGAPKVTLGLGISAGVPEAAIAAENPNGADGKREFDGILTACGFPCGYQEKADTYLDMRVVYQYYCKNLPRPNEKQYPLWEGLDIKPGEKPLQEIIEDLDQRVDECTGLQSSPERRSAQQRSNLANIFNVTHIDQALFLERYPMFLNVISRQYGGNVASNIGVQYHGSTDDAALNRNVARYAADPKAKARFDLDAESTGNIVIPVLTLHGIGDQIPVQAEAKYAEKVGKSGKSDLLLQTYFFVLGHCDLSKSELNGAAATLMGWIATGKKPTTNDVLENCNKEPGAHNGSRECMVAPNYQPESQLGTR